MILFVFSIAFMLIGALFFLFQKPVTKSALLLLILFPLAAISIYWAFGHSQAWLSYKTEQTLPKNLPNINQVILELQNHLAKNPNSAEGFYLLGRLYLSEQQFSKASFAFAKANQLQPNQINTLLNYAESLFMQQNEKNDLLIETLLNQALKIDPQNEVAINLLAIHFYQQKDYAKSIQLWEKLSEHYPPDSPEGQAILTAIAKAQKNEA